MRGQHAGEETTGKEDRVEITVLPQKECTSCTNYFSADNGTQTNRVHGGKVP